MMELAACRPGDGAHMLRPPPPGLQHEPADHHLSDSDRARRCPLEREDFVGNRQVLRSRRSCVHPSLPRSTAQHGTLTPLGAQRASMYPRLSFSRELGIPDLTDPGRSETLLEQVQL